MKYNGLLSEVWRNIACHTGLAEILHALSPRLLQTAGAAAVVIRRVDLPRRGLETVGVASAPGLEVRRHCSLGPGAFEALMDWCAHGTDQPSGVRPAQAAWLGLASGGGSEVVGGTLVSNGEVIGILLATADGGAVNREAVEALLGPMAAALANERRLHELSALREAAEAERRSLRARLGRDGSADQIVGDEGGLQGVMDRVRLVAKSDLPVLLLGETGSGKEVVARAIHTRSGRAEGPFHRVNCGALPPELIDSELFGHERGSFTGAVAQRRGWFERADGGTLFLDEIGELPPAAQVRLLRVLQDGRFERVGGERGVSVDVRIVAATHRDLHAMVREGSFREDLWYRVAVFPIRIPALRERVEDVPALAAHFALRAARRFGAPPLTPGADDLRLLCSYDWPGNVRELAAVIDRAVILGEGRRLEVAKALGGAPAHAPPRGETTSVVTDARPGGVFPTLDAAISRHIEAALEQTRGRIEGPGGAAALLRVNPHTLRARMRKLGIEWARYRSVGS